MTEEYAIYRDYQKVENYLRREQSFWRDSMKRHYDADTLEGFKHLFPVPEPDGIEEEFFDEFIEAEKCYDNPQTQAQMAELERYGFFYK